MQSLILCSLWRHKLASSTLLFIESIIWMIAWCRHITEADLHFFQQRAEEDVIIPGAGKWEHMTDLRLDSLTYSAWRRRLPVSLHYTPAPPPFSMFVNQHNASSLAVLALGEEMQPMLLQDGKTEYKSTTVADDATAEEFMDFYLDDSSRHTWVSDRPCKSYTLQFKLLPSVSALSWWSLSRTQLSSSII